MSAHQAQAFPGTPIVRYEGNEGESARDIGADIAGGGG